MHEGSLQRSANAILSEGFPALSVCDADPTAKHARHSKNSSMHWIWSVVAALTANVVRTHMPRTGSTLYLSFDDGPHPEHTPLLLDLLRQHEARATFFLIGDQVELYPDVVRRIVAEGHSIGNHSMRHPRMPALPAHAQLADIAEADAVLRPFNGRERQLFRPPNGRATAPMILSSLRWKRSLVLWNVDSRDFELSGPQVVERLQGVPLQGGDILLFHDDTGTSTLALAELLPRWRSAGYSFAAL